MEEQQEQQINEVIVNYNDEQLEQVLNKYFKTLEQQEKEKKELQKKELEQQELEQQELEENSTSSLELQKELISEIRELKEFQQYGNNLGYFSITIILLILASSLMYKFLKIFM